MCFVYVFVYVYIVYNGLSEAEYQKLSLFQPLLNHALFRAFVCLFICLVSCIDFLKTKNQTKAKQKTCVCLWQVNQTKCLGSF